MGKTKIKLFVILDCLPICGSFYGKVMEGISYDLTTGSYSIQIGGIHLMSLKPPAFLIYRPILHMKCEVVFVVRLFLIMTVLVK